MRYWRIRRVTSLRLSVLLISSQFVFLAPTARAAGFTINSTGDDTDIIPGDGSCDTGGTNSEGNPECTLRAAMEEADALAGADNINFNIPTNDP